MTNINIRPYLISERISYASVSYKRASTVLYINNCVKTAFRGYHTRQVYNSTLLSSPHQKSGSGALPFEVSSSEFLSPFNLNPD